MATYLKNLFRKVFKAKRKPFEIDPDEEFVGDAAFADDLSPYAAQPFTVPHPRPPVKPSQPSQEREGGDLYGRDEEGAIEMQVPQMKDPEAESEAVTRQWRIEARRQQDLRDRVLPFTPAATLPAIAELDAQVLQAGEEAQRARAKRT